MISRAAMSITAGATVTALLVAAATPSYADVSVGVGLNAGQGQVQVQGQLQIGTPPPPPAPPAEAPVYQGYPQQYPQGYPPPGPYPPGYYTPGYPPGMQPYAPMQRVPIRYEMKPRAGLIIAGSIMLGAAYLTTAGVTGFVNALECNGNPSCSGVYWPLYVPLIGPFIYLGVGDRTAALLASPALVISGLAQVGGLTMIILGAVLRHRVPVYADGMPRVGLIPFYTPTGGSGMAAVGRF